MQANKHDIQIGKQERQAPKWSSAASLKFGPNDGAARLLAPVSMSEARPPGHQIMLLLATHGPVSKCTWVSAPCFRLGFDSHGPPTFGLVANSTRIWSASALGYQDIYSENPHHGPPGNGQRVETFCFRLSPPPDPKASHPGWEQAPNLRL